MNLIDKLVNVKISISEGVDSGVSFSNILLLGPAPNLEEGKVMGIAAYASADEMLDAGWTVNDEAYKAACIAFMNGASELYVAPFSVAESTDSEEGSNPILETLAAALEVDGWYGLYVCGVNEEDYKDIADWAETNGKLFGYTVDCAINGGIHNPVPSLYSYAFGMATKCLDKNENNRHLALAVLAKALTLQAGSETWAYKTLSGVSNDTFTAADITALKEANLNYYVSVAGRAITLEGKTTSGEWIDIIRFRDWLLNDMQTRIFNLFIKNPKVPYTDAGITLIQNQMIASLKEGQSVGGIAQTEYDDEGNEIPGFTTSVPKSSGVSDADKASRTLSGCTFTARLANAIHIVEISGTLTA